ncbi:DUF4010 domain-containing protein [Ensifer sp. HO-A22]|uniref:DUF4010 domain-containing protein n=1 Tax=Ensifer oleiphilus TaxID=2742698 RepID=A0A7Y6Q6G3_9HYPH|nr:MgtC/SapB family protein [Ensifer oleiphilus]NVD39924.1 DUF4010 domain-containing protein [Ensifer oleiphilus]
MEELVSRLGIALAIGLLVGLERGWRERDAPAGSRTAGIRTFGIVGLLGGVFAALSKEYEQGIIFAAGFIGFAFSFCWFKVREATHDGDYSVTGVVAGFCVFALGGLAVSGDYRAAGAGGAVLAAILSSRDVLHSLLQRLSWVELRSALLLAVMTAVILPLLPDRPIDPWGGFNPRAVWFFTVLSAVISYCGYIAIRLLGTTKGLIVSGLAGALVSSTAVTVSFGQKAASGEEPSSLAGAAMLAATVSLLRVFVLVLVLAPSLAGGLIATIAPAACVFALFGAILLARGDLRENSHVAAHNPFELMPLLVFAGMFAITMTLSAVLANRVGNAGFLIVSAVSALFDVDVSVLSSLRLLGHSVGAEIVTSGVLVALVSNAFGRLVLAAIASPVAYWGRLALATVLAVSAGAAAYALIS